MKKFLTKLAFFTLLLLVTGAFLLFISIQQMNRKEFFVLKSPQTNVLFFGDSHVQCMILEDIFPTARNLASSGETYLYTYLKAQKILPSNPGIKKVFIEFSNRQVYSKCDHSTWSDYYIQTRVPHFASTMEWPEYKVFLERNPYSLIKTFAKVPRQQLVAFSRRNADVINVLEWGGYKSIDDNKIDSLIAARKQFGYGKDTIDQSISTINLLYLRKLIEVCKENNVQVWLFRAPLHRMTRYYSNETLFRQVVAERFSDVPFFDLKDFPLTDKEFNDFDHLSRAGAKRLSKFLNEATKDSLFNRPANVQSQLEARWIK